MFELTHTIGLLASQNLPLAYLLIYLLTIPLGNIGALGAFVLAYGGSLGPFGFPLVIVTIFLSDISTDMLAYSTGKVLRGTRFGNWIKNHLPHHAKIEAHLQKHTRRFIFLSKFLYLSSFAIIFLVGWTSCEDFKTFLKNSMQAAAIWVPFITILSTLLVSSLSYLHAANIIHHIEILFLFGILGYLLLNFGASRLIRLLFRKNST